MWLCVYERERERWRGKEREKKGGEREGGHKESRLIEERCDREKKHEVVENIGNACDVTIRGRHYYVHEVAL